jgi:hypothetical protein
LYAPTGNAIYDFANAYELDLCSEDYFTPLEDDTVCPADGSYAWYSNFILPDSEYLDDFWASGWDPYAILHFEDGANNVIGECTINLQTYSSANTDGSESSNNPLSEVVTGKSAAIAMAVLIGMLAVLAIYFCFCCQKKQDPLDKETEFTRMDDGKPPVNREQPVTKSVGGPAWTAV